MSGIGFVPEKGQDKIYREEGVPMMNIFVVSNDAYYPRLKIFARSLMKHNDDIFLTVLFSASALSEKNRIDFTAFAQKLKIKLRMFPVSEQRSGKYKLIYHITTEAYYRFLLLDVFPSEERALWMDTDTVVFNSLKPFYNSDFEDNYVAAVPSVPKKREKDALARLGLDTEGCYFNAGVILFNLNKIRRDFAPDFLYDIYEKHESIIKLADQDVLNIAFAGRIKKAAQINNFTVMSGQHFTLQEIRDIKGKSVVIHYIRHIKPWQHYYQGKMKYLYLKEMFPLYPLQTVCLLITGGLYHLKRNKKTLANSVK